MTRADLHVRLPDELKLRLAATAQENGRSLNAEIVYRLRKSLDGWR